jgi:hypothetical protein
MKTTTTPRTNTITITPFPKPRVKRTERGWAGHYICALRCRFRRNTLIECGDVKVVVSTVGLQEKMPFDDLEDKFERVGPGRYFETMAFYTRDGDTRYNDADITRRFNFDSPWRIDEIDADDRANDMHEAVVEEIMGKLQNDETV